MALLDAVRIRLFFVTNRLQTLLTYRIDQYEIEIVDPDYEDYHQEVAMNASAGIRMKRPAIPAGS